MAGFDRTFFHRDIETEAQTLMDEENMSPEEFKNGSYSVGTGLAGLGLIVVGAVAGAAAPIALGVTAVVIGAVGIFKKTEPADGSEAQVKASAQAAGSKHAEHHENRLMP